MSVYNGMDYLTLFRVNKEIEKRYKHYQEIICSDKFLSFNLTDKVEITARCCELGNILAMLTGFLGNAEYNDQIEKAVKEWDKLH